MTHLLDPAWLLLVPFLLIVMFSLWVLWNFSAEIRIGKRRRIRRTIYGYHQVQIYPPEKAVLRFTRSHDKEAA